MHEASQIYFEALPLSAFQGEDTNPLLNSYSDCVEEEQDCAQMPCPQLPHVQPDVRRGSTHLQLYTGGALSTE